MLRACISLGGERTTFPITISEIEPGSAIKRNDYRLEAFQVDHRQTSSIGFALIEEERLGRFHPELARQMGIPEGPLWGRIHKGEPIVLDDGRVITPSDLVGAPRRGRRIVITGDTRPCAGTILAAQDADLLVHEATFGDDEAERALETGHSTAREAADVARRAGVRRLVLTHISARYSSDAKVLEREARTIFANTTVARDGAEIELPLTEEIATGAL